MKIVPHTKIEIAIPVEDLDAIEMIAEMRGIGANEEIKIAIAQHIYICQKKAKVIINEHGMEKEVRF